MYRKQLCLDSQHVLLMSQPASLYHSSFLILHQPHYCYYYRGNPGDITNTRVRFQEQKCTVARKIPRHKDLPQGYLIPECPQGRQKVPSAISENCSWQEQNWDFKCMPGRCTMEALLHIIIAGLPTEFVSSVLNNNTRKTTCKCCLLGPGLCEAFHTYFKV